MNGALFIMSKPVRRTLFRRREKRKSLALDDYDSKDKLLESTSSNSSMTTLGKNIKNKKKNQKMILISLSLSFSLTSLSYGAFWSFLLVSNRNDKSQQLFYLSLSLWENKNRSKRLKWQILNRICLLLSSAISFFFTENLLNKKKKTILMW